MNPTALSADWMALIAVVISAAVMLFLFRRLMRGMNQQDWILLRNARARGINPTEPQSVDFVCFLASEEAAAAVAETLRNDGFETSTKQAQIQYARNRRKPGEPQGGCLVTANRTLVLEPAELTKLRARFNEVAAAQKGIYCGWQISAGAAKPEPSPARQ